MDFETLIVIYLIILIVVVFYYVIPKLQRLEKIVYVEVSPVGFSPVFESEIGFKKFSKNTRLKKQKPTKSKIK